MQSPGDNLPRPDTTLNTAPKPDVVSVSLVRGAHRWVFRCSTGEEPTMVRHLAELAERTDCPLDRFDAALVAQHLNQKLAAGLHKVRAASPADQENS